MNKKFLPHIFVLIVLLAGGAWLRWADIASESLWTDELYSMHWAQKSVAQILANAASDVHPPTYYVLLHFWVKAFGASEAALRALSALLGVLALPLMYALGRSIAPEPHKTATGIAAAAFLAVSHIHVYYAHEARNYTLTVLCAVWSMLAFVRLLEYVFFERESITIKLPRALHYIVATIALMHTHLFALFAVFAQSVFVASVLVFSMLVPSTRFGREQRWKLARTWFVLQAVLLVLFVPWGRILLHQILSVNKQGFWIEEPTIFTLAETFAEYAGGFWLLVLFAALCFIAVLRVEKIERVEQIERTPSRDIRSLQGSIQNFIQKFIQHAIQNSAWRVRLDGMAVAWILLLWLAMPIAIPFVKSILSKPSVYYIKYTIPALPALLLLAAKGIAAIPSRVAQGAVIAAVVVLSLVAVAEEWGNEAVHLNKERWREAAQTLDSAVAPNDVVLTHQWYYEWALEYYKPQRFSIQAVPSQFLKLRADVVQRLIDHACTLPQQQQPRRVWLVLAQRNAGWTLIRDELVRRGYTQRDERVLPSFYRKYFVRDEYAASQTVISLKKTYWTPHIRLLLFEKTEQNEH